MIQLGFNYRLQIGKMGGVMLTMSLAMVNGLVFGVIAADVFKNAIFFAMLLSVILASGLGFITGLPFGFLALLDGLLSGVMSGTMGAMLAKMFASSVNSVLAFLLLFEMMVLVILFMFIKQKVTALLVFVDKRSIRRVLLQLKIKFFR